MVLMVMFWKVINQKMERFIEDKNFWFNLKESLKSLHLFVVCSAFLFF